MSSLKSKLKIIQRNLSASLEVETEHVAKIIKKSPLSLKKTKRDSPDIDTNQQNQPEHQNSANKSMKADNTHAKQDQPSKKVTNVKQPPKVNVQNVKSTLPPPPVVSSSPPDNQNQISSLPPTTEPTMADNYTQASPQGFTIELPKMEDIQTVPASFDPKVQNLPPPLSPTINSISQDSGFPPSMDATYQQTLLVQTKDSTDINPNMSVSDKPAPFPEITVPGENSLNPQKKDNVPPIPAEKPSVEMTAGTGKTTTTDNVNDSKTKSSPDADNKKEKSSGSGGDSLLDLFRSEDAEDNPIADLAITLPEVNIYNLLEKARQIAKEIKGNNN